MRRIAALLLIGVFAGTVAAQDDDEYRVRYGDTLDVIAQEMNVSVACLAGANELTNANTLTFGQVLIIPADCSPYDQIESVIISNVEDLSDNALLASGLGRDGRPEEAETEEETASTQSAEATPEAEAIEDEVYVVQAGDNLTKIAAQFEITPQCLQDTNFIADPDLIYTGQELLISADCQGGGGDLIPGAARQCFGDRNAGRAVRGGVYTVQEGDTLDFIGCDLNLSTACLVALNDLPNKGGGLVIGQTLTIDNSCSGWDGPPGPGDLG
jgi:LysM repeat protein